MYVCVCTHTHIHTHTYTQKYLEPVVTMETEAAARNLSDEMDDKASGLFLCRHDLI